MIVGRRGERRRIEELLDEARLGRSGSLVVRGDAGVGKTTLLTYARDRANDLPILTTHGVESESEFAYAGLAELLRPLLPGLERLPPPQAQAVASACAVSEPVPFDRFAAYVGALSLVAEAAERTGAVLATVDDAQWLDAVSQEALLFIARRLRAEGVVMLFAARTGEAMEFDSPGVPELELAGLEQKFALELLERHAPAPVAPEVAARIIAETDGNPLALTEVSTLLTASELSGLRPLPTPFRAGATVERAFRSRLGRLSRTAAQALAVAAASESGSTGEVAAACAALELPADSLEEAEAARLVSLDVDRIVFRHPLVRSAAYYAVGRAERRRAHRALADALVGADPARRAWHLAAASVAPDEAVAVELEQVGLETRRRGGHRAAALAFERAARCTPTAADRSRRLYDAASDADLAGLSERAIELLDEALPYAEAALRPDIGFLRARIELTRGAPSEARQRLLAEASSLETDEPARAAVMLSKVVGTCFHEGELETACAVAERAHELAKRVGGLAETAAEGSVGVAMILLGDAKEGRPLLEGCHALLDEGDVLAGHQLALFLGQVSMWLEEYERARLVVGRVIAAARTESAVGLLPYPLLVQSELDYRTGRWTAAAASGAESVQLAEELGHEATVMHALSVLARVEAALGRETHARDHARRALRIAEALGAGAHLVYARSVLGFLALGLGDHETAIGELAEVERLARRFRLAEPGVAHWAPDLVEAHVRNGLAEAAAETLGLFGEQAERTERTWALATAARCRGLLCGDDEFEEHFTEALSWHAQTPTPFERARTELCFGERLRRAKRQSEARIRLHAALETLEALGATPWVERARAELRAAGGRAGRTAESARDSLTAQELQVALLVAEGATNREAAASLFLSPKTVEFHLGNAYRKLNVRSRSELARVFAREAVPEPALSPSV